MKKERARNARSYYRTYTILTQCFLEYNTQPITATTNSATGNVSQIPFMPHIFAMKKDNGMIRINPRSNVKICAGSALSVDVKNHKVLVEGVNKVTKHAKPSQANPNGGIVQKEAPIDISNVMLVVKGKATRVGFKMENGKKVRFAKSTGEVID